MAFAEIHTNFDAHGRFDHQFRNRSRLGVQLHELGELRGVDQKIEAKEEGWEQGHTRG